VTFRQRIEAERPAGTPILRRRKIGDRFRGAIVHYETRDQRDEKGGPRLKADGRTAKELVVHLLTIRSTMPVGRSDDEWTPDEGTICRLILKGGAWGQWIDASKTVDGGVCRGDLLEHGTTHADFFKGAGAPVGRGEDESEIDTARRKGWTVGYRGSLTITAGSDQALTDRCNAAYQSMATDKRTPIVDDTEEMW
jgi:hypothetical protein